MLIEVFVLLLVFQFKHFFADYPLQTKFMLGKFKPGWDFLPPLLAHVGVHALFTLAICLVARPSMWWLALVDAVVHFIMDRIKAGPKYLGAFKALTGKEFMQCSRATMNDQIIYDSDTGKEVVLTTPEAISKIKGNTYFWWSLGLDQMVHHLTHYFIIWMIVS